MTIVDTPLPLATSVAPNWIVEGRVETVEVQGEKFIAGNFTCYLDETPLSMRFVLLKIASCV